ncbi:MAG: hypothetical protein OEM59_07320 [Rhodospirillales bacterium]|nr:hypothetical protein [Rhodospirillales bacterium]
MTADPAQGTARGAAGTPGRAAQQRKGGSWRFVAIFVLTFLALAAIGAGRGEGGLGTLLQGPDDQMRMVQVRDWLGGQGWRDPVQRRLDPPEGVAMHWSRIADLPLAAVIAAAQPVAGRAAAEVLAASLVPPLLGGLFAGFFVWAGVALTPSGRALVPVLLIGTLVIPFQQLLPGRIDHHGLQLVLIALALGFLLRAVTTERTAPVAGLGLVGALSLAIGLEALPFLGAATIALTLAWLTAGGRARAWALAVFGVVLAGATLALLPLTLAPGQWTEAVCDRMSVAHLALTAIVPAAGAGALSLSRRSAAPWGLRLAAMAAIGGGGLVVVAAAFPHCMGSPYADLPAEARYWFEAVSEAQPWTDYFKRKPGIAIGFAILPVAALLSLAVAWARSSAPRAAVWPALMVLVLSGAALLAWQIRGVNYAALTAGLGLVPFAVLVNARADRARALLARVGLRLAVPMMAILPVAAPHLEISGKGIKPQDAANLRAGCDVNNAVAALNDPKGLGARRLTIAAPVDAGPAVLVLTRHRVLAAPYHRNVQGLADNRRVFAGTEAVARATLARRGIGAVLFCRKHAGLSVYDGQPAFLNERLAAGRPPDWLAPVMSAEGLSLYRVRTEALR